VSYRDGQLVRWKACAWPSWPSAHGTPLFVYSQRRHPGCAGGLPARAGRAPHALICYAMKANSTLAILKLLADQGCGFDIVSGGELERVLAVGAMPAKIIFSGIGKTRAEMALCAEGAGIGCFNVESLAELDVSTTWPMASGSASAHQHPRQSRTWTPRRTLISPPG
jgi:diaminopimelate decarboxylase